MRNVANNRIYGWLLLLPLVALPGLSLVSKQALAEESPSSASAAVSSEQETASGAAAADPLQLDPSLSPELQRQERLGYYYWGRGDVFAGMRYLRPVAAAGHALSQYRLAEMLYGASDFEVAAEWYRQALKGGVSKAALGLSLMHRNGYLNQSSAKRAFEVELQAAQAGLAKAAQLVANAYETGSGVAASQEKALQWYRRAAAKGSVPAIRRLINAHRDGALGLDQNEEAQAELEQQLAEATEAENEQRRQLRQDAFKTFRAIEKAYLN